MPKAAEALYTVIGLEEKLSSINNISRSRKIPFRENMFSCHTERTVNVRREERRKKVASELIQVRIPFYSDSPFESVSSGSEIMARVDVYYGINKSPVSVTGSILSACVLSP